VRYGESDERVMRMQCVPDDFQRRHDYDLFGFGEMHLHALARRTLLLLLVCSASAHAAEITVSLHAPSGDPIQGEITVSAVSNAPPRDRTLGVNGTASVSLDDGETWVVAASARGYLRSEFMLPVAKDGPKKTVDVLLWPAAHVIARIPKSSDVKKVSISYRPVDPSADPPAPTDKQDCVLNDRRVECDVPAALIDFNLHATSSASIYRWSEQLKAGDRKDLGELRFVPGASLVGHVVGPKGDVPQTVKVTLAPMFFRSTARPLDVHRTDLMFRSINAVKGFFQFEGLTPGRYEVSASSPQLVSDRIEVTVIGGAEAALNDPLVLSPPRRVDVHVSPILDPWGSPWTVQLERVDEASNLRTLVKSTVAMGGEWSSTSLAPGRYRLQIRRLPQGSWYSETFGIERDLQKWINLDLAIVRGRVRIGEKPVRGYVWFGGDHSDISIPIPTSKEGYFRANLPIPPDDHQWHEIDIVAEDPPLRRALHDVHLAQAPGDSSEYEVDLTLPERGIFGEVVDASGKPAAGVSVYAFHGKLDDGSVEVLTDAVGGFGFDGLESGDYAVRAVGSDRQSQTEHITVGEDERVHSVHLTLATKTELSGQMIGPAGPIVGGRVWILPPDRAAVAVVPTETDLEGRFRVAVAPSQPYAVVVASSPGLAFRSLRILLPTESLDLRMSSDSARLTFECADFGKAFASGFLPVVMHAGSYLPLALITAWSAEASTQMISPTTQRVTAARLEPGEYTLCYARQATVGGETVPQPMKCASGVATSGGALTLSIAYSD
jgi:hypothetical protein